MSWSVDGEPLGRWRAVTVPAGSRLVAGPAHDGCRGYLAVAGGFDVPLVLGSRATYAPAALGGLHGRPLRAGDLLRVDAAPGPHAPGRVRALAPAARPTYGGVVRLVAGPRLDALAPASRTRLLGEPFRVSAHSDRMGVRLEVEGPGLALAERAEVLSAGVATGTVQLPPGGAPIILMADRQTTGGYPRLGEVATVDLPRVAQLRPGDTVRFATVSLAEAQQLYLARERELALLERLLAVPA
jgi:antagonist of KipI